MERAKDGEKVFTILTGFDGDTIAALRAMFDPDVDISYLESFLNSKPTRR